MVMMSGLETSRSKNSKNDLTEIKKALLTGNAFLLKPEFFFAIKRA